MTDQKLSEIYYQPEHMWKGRKAFKKLKEASGVSLKTVKLWLSKQALWQIHLPRPKTIDYAHFRVTEVNKIHQADLLYLPHDKVYQNTYKYCLNVIDIASRFKASRPLRTKKPKDVADSLKDIYKKGPLRYPQEFHCDNGSEFKGAVNTLLKDHNVEFKQVTTKHRKRFMAFVERFNKTLADKLFKVQDAQEINDPTHDSKVWIKHLQNIVKAINKEKTEMIEMEPSKAIKLQHVTLKTQSYPTEEVLPTDGLYRYLYEPGELEGG